mgnify:CR=1 FL=1
MAEEPDRLRQDIESTRASLTRDVDLLAEKTSPAKVAQRRWTAVKEKVMGSSEHAKYSAGQAAGTASEICRVEPLRPLTTWSWVPMRCFISPTWLTRPTTRPCFCPCRATC